MLAVQSLSKMQLAATSSAPPLTMVSKDLAARQEEDGASRQVLMAFMLTKECTMRRLTRLLRCEKGANAIEYALVATLISIAALAAFQNLGSKVDAMLNNVSNHL